MEDQPHPSSGSSDRLVLQARLTTFHIDESDMPSIAEWWHSVFGENPERVEYKQREQTVQVSGNLPDGQLTVNSSPGRTDFILDQQRTNQHQQRRLVSLGDRALPASHQEHRKSRKNWLGTTTPVYRLALGAVLLLPAQDLHSVYQVLTKLLPGFRLEGISTPDFLYRVNRQRVSTQVPDVLINSLVAWSTAQGQSITIPAGRGEPRPGPIQYAAHLELDINSGTGEETLLNPEMSQALLHELIELGNEITNEGDKP